MKKPVKFADIEFVTIGQGKSVHAAYVYVSSGGTEYLGARCDRTGWAGIAAGRVVRPAVQYPHRPALEVTCKSCRKIMEGDA